MSPHFSDEFHLDPCDGRFCGSMLSRREMSRVEGRRGWFCPRCLPTHPPRKKLK